jgi:hypothetical protein
LVRFDKALSRVTASSGEVPNAVTYYEVPDSRADGCDDTSGFESIDEEACWREERASSEEDIQIIKPDCLMLDPNCAR